jgi:DNA-binding response OmpR family regulator
MSNESKNILIVEDDERVASVIKRSLEELGYHITLAYDGFMGRKLALQESYAVIILDVILPKINGLDLCKEIKNVKPNLPIIMLTALGTTDDKIEGFDAGADDYLVKPFESRELMARIRALSKRNSFTTATVTENKLYLADLILDTHRKTVVRNGTEISLTPKEFKLLEYMMRNSERVLSRAEISEKVWETTFDTGTNFIDVYMNYLRKKIDKDFDLKLIHTKPGMGFIIKGA